MAGYVLGHAAILDGRNALQTQSYGSESRGGAAKSDIVISDTEILDLAPAESDVLIALAQPALDKYAPSLKQDGILVYESDLVRVPSTLPPLPYSERDGVRISETSSEPAHDLPRAFGLPATEIARTTFGRDVVANVIVVGFLAGLLNVPTRSSLHRAISESVPPKTVEMNLQAFEEGFRRGNQERPRALKNACA